MVTLYGLQPHCMASPTLRLGQRSKHQLSHFYSVKHTHISLQLIQSMFYSLHRCRPTLVLTGTSIPLYDSRFDSGSERVKMFSSRPFMRKSKSVPVVKQDKIMAFKPKSASIYISLYPINRLSPMPLSQHSGVRLL